MAAITPVRAVGQVLTRPVPITMAGPATQVVMAEDFTRDMFPRRMATRIMPDTIGDGKWQRAGWRPVNLLEKATGRRMASLHLRGGCSRFSSVSHRGWGHAEC